MTPNDIEILIHCHISPDIHPRIAAPAVAKAHTEFVENGIIELDNEGCYHTTSRGQALIAILCSTPWPVQVWVDQNGRVIEI